MWGALGSGVAIFFSYGILTGLYLYWTQRVHPIPLEAKKLIFSLCIICSTLAVVSYLNSISWNATVLLYKLLFLSLMLLLGFWMEMEGVSGFRRFYARYFS